MDEQEYKDAYNRINSLRCVFEKTMCSLNGGCSQGQMFRLADRHGFGCQSPLMQQQCSHYLNHLRNQTRFVFKLAEIDGQLPHNKEIRVQLGGLQGLRKLLDNHSGNTPIADVSQLLQQAVAHYGAIENFPYTALMQTITAIQPRPKRRADKT